MAQATDWTDLDDLLGLRVWLTSASDDALTQAAPAARLSRSEMLAKLDNLIEMLGNVPRQQGWPVRDT
jgi:hypothetical protein